MRSPAAGRVLLELLSRGPASRSELARRLELSTPTLTRLTKPLLAGGLLQETFTGPGEPVRTGRPSRPLAVVPAAARFVGVKVSRSGLDGVVIDLAGTVLSHRWAALSSADVGAVVDATVRLVGELAADQGGVVAGGVAVGGRVAGERVIGSVSGFDGDDWNRDDWDLLTPIQARTAVPVRLINDVHAYLLAEQWLGAGRGSASLLLITVGVSVGCAYATDGRLQTGERSTAGLLGHWPLTVSGPCCDLGHAGCSGGWLPVDRVLGRVATVLGRRVTLDEAVTTAAYDAGVAVVLREAATQLGRLAGLAAKVIGPARVVLGGDAVDYVRFGEAELRAAFDAVHDPMAVAELVINSETGFLDWARGAAVAALGEWVATLPGVAD